VSNTQLFSCFRDNEFPAPGEPNVWGCVLTPVDTGLIATGGSWTTSGPNPEKIFVVTSGTWQFGAHRATLSSDDGDATKDILMEKFEDSNGSLTGKGLVDGQARWTRT
jgi:hypothetical protein